jgi:hypothetical protein
MASAMSCKAPRTVAAAYQMSGNACLLERVVNVFTQEPCASERSPDFVRLFWARPRGTAPAFIRCTSGCVLTNIYGAVYRRDRRAEVFEGWADLQIDVEIITSTSVPDAALDIDRRQA